MINLEKYNKDMEEGLKEWFLDNSITVSDIEGRAFSAIKYKQASDYIKSSHKSLLKKIAEEEVERNQKQANIHQEIIDTYAIAPFKWHKGRRDEALKNVTEFDKTTGHNSALKLVEDYIDKE